MLVRSSVLLILACVFVCALPDARAEQAPLARFSTPQGPLAFALREGRLLAAACPGARCDFENGVELPVPAELLPRVSSSSFTRLELEQKRVVVRLTVPAEERAWEALVTPSLERKGAPKVAFADWTGLGVDDDGERRGHRIELYTGEKGATQVIVGGLRGDVELCGRPTLIDPKVLYPNDLELHRIKWMRLSEQERAAAVTLVPVSDEPPLGTPISRARVASSAKGSPAFLSDGKAKTVWMEDRGGDGRGEFVIFKTPQALPVTQFAWTYAPQPESLPKVFWVATDHALFRVDFDPAKQLPGTQFRVELPAPETTSCVALVLDGAPTSEGNVDVGFAEFEARAAIDDAAIAGLVNQLDDPQTDPVPVIETLAALGKASVTALSARYESLSPAGKSRALTVYDSLPCAETVRAYVAALQSAASDAPLIERLERCGQLGEKAALRALPKADGERALLLAQLLVRVNPARAIDELVPLLAKSNRDQRRALRGALASIAGRPELTPAFTQRLADPELPRVAAIDLLRALGENITAYREPAAHRIRALLDNEPNYRTRYLLIQPLARLAPSEPRFAQALDNFLNRDEQDAVRAQTARWFPTAPTLVPALVQAADDPHVRVREAAILNLGEHAVEAGRSVLLRRLKSDPWPFIRAASIKGLLALEPSPAIDDALAHAAEGDEAASVRRPAVLALGARNARGKVEVVRERLADDDEDPYVRAAAAATLGTLCDFASIDELDQLGRKIARLSDDEATQVVGRAALTALGRLSPPDLKRRLEAFDGDEVPPWAKQVADAALHHPEPCRR